MNSADTSLKELNRWMLAHHMHGYWMQEGGGSGTQHKPYLWQWTDIYAWLLKAGELVPVGPSGMTEMRTIGLRNPEGRGVPRTISLSPQILIPGDRTRAHRNLNNETRFVIQAPPGAVFIAQGEAFPMEEGDLVVSLERVALRLAVHGLGEVPERELAEVAAGPPELLGGGVQGGW